MAHRVERLPLGAGTPGTRREVMLHRFGETGARPKAYTPTRSRRFWSPTTWSGAWPRPRV